MMQTKLLMLTIGTWFLFMILAIFNAIVRESIFSSFLNELRAHQLSTLTLMIIIFTITYLILHYTQIKLSDQQAIFIGLIWMLMTISFEFIAGHYLFGNSWEKLISDYNLLNGRIWIFIPITSIISPYLATKILYSF